MKNKYSPDYILDGIIFFNTIFSYLFLIGNYTIFKIITRKLNGDSLNHFYYFKSNLKQKNMKKILTLISLYTVSIAGLWAQATPNPSFDTWTTTGFPTYAVATGWDSPNSQTNVTGTFVCIKATVAADIHTGSAAVKLTSKSVLGQIAPGVVTTGTLPTANGNPITGGVPYTLRPDSIVGYYKSAPAGGESGFVEFSLFGAGGSNDTIAVGRFIMPTTAVSTYTRFSKKIIYRSANAVVNSVWVLSSSGTNPVAGSTIFIDDLSLKMPSTVGVTEQILSDFTVGPNPAVDHLIIRNTVNAKNIFCLHDLTGRLVIEEKIAATSNIVNINSFPAGLYIYSIKDENNTAIKTGKLIIKK